MGANMNLESLGHRIKNAFGRNEPNRKIFFMHLPKTGGTSVDDAFLNVFKTITYKEYAAYARHDSIASASMAELLYGYDFDAVMPMIMRCNALESSMLHIS